MPYLHVIKGPNQGLRVSVDRAKTILGREPICDVVLYSADVESRKHLVISRKHALITRVQDKFYVEDGDGEGKHSRNHTFVNGDRVPFPGRVLLKNQDVIQICDFSLVFHEAAWDPNDQEEPPSSIDASVSHDSSSLYLAQPAEKLKELLEITNRLSNTLELDKLLPQVVDNLLQIFRQADRGFLILADDATSELVVRSLKTRRPQEEGQTGYSRSIVMLCLRKVDGLLLSNDPSISKAEAAKLPNSDSVAGLALRSVMCAPLWSEGKAFGVLLLDSQSEKKKFTEEDLKLLMAVASQASIALANARFHRDALVRERLSRDLVLAREVVQSFLPSCLPQLPGYEFFACCESALEVGGDYYDLVPLAGNRLGILVGDVAGKGVAAALVMARFSAEVRACLRTEPDLAAAVCQLNTLMQPLCLTDRFVTLVTLLLDPATHTLTMVNAGHPPPLLVRRATGTIEDALPRADNGPLLGVIDGYPYEARQIALQVGDSLVLYSDGVLDARATDGQPLELPGLRNVVQRVQGPPRQMGERVLQAVKDYAAGCEQYDDITLVCFGRTA